MDIERLKEETKEIILKGKYPDIIKQLEYIYEAIEQLQAAALFWEGQASYWENQYFNKEVNLEEMRRCFGTSNK